MNVHTSLGCIREVQFKALLDKATLVHHEQDQLRAIEHCSLQKGPQSHDMGCGSNRHVPPGGARQATDALLKLKLSSYLCEVAL